MREDKSTLPFQCRNCCVSFPFRSFALNGYGFIDPVLFLSAQRLFSFFQRSPSPFFLFSVGTTIKSVASLGFEGNI